MTRKKYIKKLMSCGMKRNAAERLARATAASGVSYKEEWVWRCCFAAPLNGGA